MNHYLNGSLLTVSQSFVGGVVAYNALTRPQFSQLQQKIFPIYFGITTALPVVLAMTYPTSKLDLGSVSGYAGVFADANRWTVAIPLATMLVTSVANLLWAGPATTEIMIHRKHQGQSRWHTWRWIMLTQLHRNQRWKEILRGRPTIERDEEAQYLFCNHAWRFLVVEHGGLDRDYVVRRDIG